MSNKIQTKIENGIAWITMDDGKVNAMSTDMMGEIQNALSEAERAEAVTVLRGRERIFSAGFDLQTFMKGMDASKEMVLAGAKLIQRFLSFPFPLLTVCTGHAYPMGAFLMLSADVRYGIAGPWKIGMNEVAIRLTVPKFAIELARHRLSPPGVVRINTAAMFAPEEALRLGYLDRVVDIEQLDQAVQEEALRLRSLDMTSFQATKARVNDQVLRHIAAAMEDDFGR